MILDMIMTNFFTTYRNSVFVFRFKFFTDCAKTVALDLTNIQATIKLEDQLSNKVASVTSTIGTASGVLDFFLDSYLPITSLRFTVSALDTITGEAIIFNGIVAERVDTSNVDFKVDSITKYASAIDAPVFYSGVLINKNKPN